MGRLRRITVSKASSGEDSKQFKPAMLERLEPRIMLSGDSLLSCLNLPNPVENTPAINTDIHIQNVDILQSNDSSQHASENAINSGIYKPILTISQDNKDIENTGIPEGRDEAFGPEIAPGRNDVNEFLSRFEELPESAKTSPEDFAFGQEISAQRKQDDDENSILDDVALVQSNENVIIESNGSDERLNNELDPDLAANIPADDTVENGIALQTGDGRSPIYNSDADLNVEYATSIEIRGPPANNVESSITSELSTYAISDEVAGSSEVESTYTFTSPPELPGLVLVDPNIKSWEGQIIYLDFNGTEDVIYDGPVTVGPFDVPIFSLEGTSLSGQEQEIINQVLVELEYIFTGTGIVFTTSQPFDDTKYSTIYIGGDDSIFASYGAFFGLAEKIDVGNEDLRDEGLVFSRNLIGGSIREYIETLADTIAHEVAHLVGFAHIGVDNESPLNNVAAINETEPNDTLPSALALPLAEDPSSSGYLLGRGLGNIQPSADVDWWSFEALAGDLISVSVDTPDSDLNPYVSLRDAADILLSSDSNGGPGADAFISRYVITSSGTYYVRITSEYSGTGSYEVRVDLARGIELESDRDYANDTLAGADSLTLVRGDPGH
ncbi:MAG: PPC domain-containing protein, partial [Promethearchaeota archaeon]